MSIGELQRMTFMIKSASVHFKGIAPELIMGMLVFEQCYRFYQPDSTMVITSCNDDIHMHVSLHYEGKAMDIRANILPLNRARVIRDKAIVYLGKVNGGEFDIILENEGTPNVHFHIEYDPNSH